MTVTLTPEQEELVIEQLQSGSFQTAQDVLGHSLEILRAQETFIRTHAGELQQQIAAGLKQTGKGEIVDGKTAVQKLREDLRSRESGSR